LTLVTRFGALALSIIVAASPLAAQAPESAPQLASRIQAHYSTVRDFTADFTLNQTSGLLPQAKTERGTVKIKKPLRMWWNYTTSDKQQFISDGSRLYLYQPRDKVVTVTPLPADEEASTALLFLAGRGNLTRDFKATLPADQPAGEWRLVLEPAGTRKADFRTLTLEVDRQSLQLRGLVVVDEQGGTSKFRFTNMRENRGLTDQEFAFTIPKGVAIR
jgi:outer membrane lipoprotein carrier protein